jgi:hypothetical protein
MPQTQVPVWKNMATLQGKKISIEKHRTEKERKFLLNVLSKEEAKLETKGRQTMV